MNRISIIPYGIAFSAITLLFKKPSEPCRHADLYLARGVDTIHLKDVEIVDEQEEFCMFKHNGVLKMERAPYEVICNQ